MSVIATSVDRGPGVSFPPPFLFVGGFGVGLLLSRIVPLAFPWAGARWIPFVALLLIAHGLGLGAIGLLTFVRARTAVYPNQPARTLVTHGIFARTRNPMYVGITLVYLGGVIALGAVWSLICLPVVLVLLTRLVIAREERYLHAAFPDEYAAYCAEVGRWL